MKIVTYNVNGLRPRIAQFGSLRKLLDSLDADVICFQETKLAKQDLRADLVRAEGYESFFSCTRTSDKGRAGYSGVATFCRVKSAFSSDEVALPLAAEEGFTGLLENSQGFESIKDNCISVAEGLEDFPTDELRKIDSEGRCIITDHGHFILFNIYGPRAECDDTERIQYKHKFFKILQRRWERLLNQGRRILAVGDFNIAPASVDRCEAGPDFERNEFRRWFRSILVQSGGQFFDVFRTKHPDRKDAYTCWSTSSGAEVFNYGSRIDHIISTKLCLHEECNQDGHDFVTCHVKECEILTQFKRWRPGNSVRWKEGRSVKLEGSDHAPVLISLSAIPSIKLHSTPSLSTRYCPQVYGVQQTIVSMFKKRQSSEVVSGTNESSEVSYCSTLPSCLQSTCDTSLSASENKKKARQSQWSQLSLNSYFQKRLGSRERSTSSRETMTHNEVGLCSTSCEFNPLVEDEDGTSKELECDISESTQGTELPDSSQCAEEDKRSTALVEWQRIQKLLQDSIPLCKGHKEPCVARVVKKAGPNMGRRFYVCARAEGPASNPEANCGYFKWAGSKTKGKG